MKIGPKATRLLLGTTALIVLGAFSPVQAQHALDQRRQQLQIQELKVQQSQQQMAQQLQIQQQQMQANPPPLQQQQFQLQQSQQQQSQNMQIESLGLQQQQELQIRRSAAGGRIPAVPPDLRVPGPY